jgi:Zn-dependent peptidase ImmA (M78 family)/transcriptional regulator with XRE-family HTH domain
MTTDIQVFAQRLKQARILKKISMDQLVNLIGGMVSKQAISKYESAKMLPNSSVLIALATALDVDLDYFYRPFTFNLNQLDVSFRKKSNTTVKDINALKVKVQDQVERYLEVDEILGKDGHEFIESTGSILSTKEEMCESAKGLRTSWSLGCGAIANTQDTLETHGIKVISTDAPDNFDGVSGVVNGKEYIIVLNGNREHIERRRFTAMHELGHLLYNKRFSEKLTALEKEKLCDAFACEMLLPSSMLQSVFKSGEKISTSELKQLQMMYGISVDAIMHKLKDIGIISENKYKNYCIRKRTDYKFKKYVEASRYQETMTNKFETMVYAAVAKNLISTSKAATLLQVSTGTIRKHLNII